jgi:hypothetical protein
MGRIPIIYTIDVGNDSCTLPAPGQQLALPPVRSEEPGFVIQDVVPLPGM